MTPVKRVRRHIVFVLMLVIPISSWAGAVVPCTQDSEPALMQQSDAVDAHAHHETGQHDLVAEAEKPIAVDCECCGDCATMCALAAGATMASVTESPDYFFSGNGAGILLLDSFHAGPVPHPLFRPPISAG